MLLAKAAAALCGLHSTVRQERISAGWGQPEPANDPQDPPGPAVSPILSGHGHYK